MTILNEITYQLSKENFHFLMDCINEYWDKTAPPQNGLLYFIRDSLIAERVVTKYQPTKMEYFKAFFCNAVLDLHDGGAELNVKEYEQYFSERQGKKYAIFTDNMNRYLDKQANMQYMRDCFEDVNLEEGEEWEDIFPILLMERLQQVSHRCLKEYFLLDEERFRRTKGMRLEGKQISSFEEAKRKLYRRFCVAACLYEIFADKFLGTDVWEQFDAYMDVMLKYAEQFRDFQKELQAYTGKWIEEKKEGGVTDKMVIEAAALAEQAKDFCEETAPVMAKANCAVSRAYFYVLHARYVMALYAVISMVEYTNVNGADDVMIPKKWKNRKNFLQMKEVFYESACDSLFIENITMNKNYCGVYKKAMEAIEEEKLIQELCSQSEKTQKEALTLVQMYFAGVLTDAGPEDEDFLTALNLIFQKSLKQSKKASFLYAMMAAKKGGFLC